MITWLEEIERDLLVRRGHARTEGWKGETEGIDLTLRVERCFTSGWGTT